MYNNALTTEVIGHFTEEHRRFTFIFKDCFKYFRFSCFQQIFKYETVSLGRAMQYLDSAQEDLIVTTSGGSWLLLMVGPAKQLLKCQKVSFVDYLNLRAG